jgi:hypothetical protein
MKRLFLYSVLALLATIFVIAGDASAKTKAKARTITGCLTKGDSADEYLLTGKDGSTWEVHSNGVALADHVGHEVAATGVVSHAKLHNLKEDTKDVAKDTGVEKRNKEHGHFNVTKLRMVSGSCKR